MKDMRKIKDYIIVLIKIARPAAAGEVLQSINELFTLCNHLAMVMLELSNLILYIPKAMM